MVDGASRKHSIVAILTLRIISLWEHPRAVGVV